MGIDVGTVRVRVYEQQGNGDWNEAAATKGGLAAEPAPTLPTTLGARGAVVSQPRRAAPLPVPRAPAPRATVTGMDVDANLVRTGPVVVAAVSLLASPSCQADLRDALLLASL